MDFNRGGIERDSNNLTLPIPPIAEEMVTGRIDKRFFIGYAAQQGQLHQKEQDISRMADATLVVESH